MKYRVLLVGLALWAMLMFIVVNSVYALSNPNYYYYSNITINSWNGTLFSLPIGNTGFIRFDTTYNAILNAQAIQHLNITAYNSHNAIIGAVGAFPWPSGNALLIANRTLTGQRYDHLAIWFGQNRTQNTYLGPYQINIQHIPRLPSLPLPISVVYYNTSGISSIPYTEVPNNGVSANASGRLNLFFSLSAPYIFQSFGNQNNNMSIDYVQLPPGTGNNYFKFTSNTNTQSISSIALFNFLSPTYTRSNTSNISIYLNPNGANYTFLSGNFGIRRTPNSYLFCQKQLQIFYDGLEACNAFNLAQQPQYVSTSYQYKLSINYTNTTPSYFSFNLFGFALIPAYTTNYSITTNTAIFTPLPPVINCSNLTNSTPGWFFTYQNRLLFNVTNWNFTFATKGYYPHNPPNTINVTTTNVGWLLLNVSKLSAMGPTCQDTYIRAYNNVTHTDLGAIPFSVVNCSPTSLRATFILKNTTDQNHVYKSAYLYFGSLNGATIFSNPAILSAWRQFYNPGQNVIIASNIIMANYGFIVKIGGGAFEYGNTINPLSAANTRVYLDNATWPLPDGMIGTLDGVTAGFVFNRGTLAFGTARSITGTDTTIYAPRFPNPINGDQDIFTSGVVGRIDSGGHAVTENAFSQFQIASGGDQAAFSLNANLAAPNTASVFGFYTSNVTTHAIQSLAIVCPSNQSQTVIPTTNGTFITNNTVANLTQNTTKANATLGTLGLNKTKNFYGLSLPYFVIAILFIILTLILVAMSDHDEQQPIIIGFVILFVVGIFVINQVLALGLAIVFVYLGYEVVQREKKGGN